MGLSLAMKMNANLVILEVDIDGADSDQQRLLSDILTRCDRNLKDLEARGETPMSDITPSLSATVPGTHEAIVTSAPLPFVDRTSSGSSKGALAREASEDTKALFEEDIRKQLEEAREGAKVLQEITQKVELDAETLKAGKQAAETCQTHNQSFVSVIPRLENDELMGDDVPTPLPSICEKVT